MRVKYYILLSAASLLSLSCAGSREKRDATASDTEVKVETAESQAPSNEEAMADDERGYIVKVGDMAPDFSLQLTNGESFKLSDMRGKVVMLQFTASWCSVCRKEMPFIERDIRQKHKDSPGFYLLGIDRDEPLAKVQEFIEQTGITYPVALDPGGDVFALYAERKAGITRNVIIDADGRIVMLTRLYNESEFAGMCRMIDEIVK
jgi:peroxiredoxin